MADDDDDDARRYTNVCNPVVFVSLYQLMLQMFALPILIKKELYSKGYLINAV